MIIILKIYFNIGLFLNYCLLKDDYINKYKIEPKQKWYSEIVDKMYSRP